MTGAVGQSEITRYVDGVRAALADLPDQLRDDLLEDLPDHLAEVAAEIAAEGAGALEDRLGPPAVYAAELRVSAGVAAAPVSGSATNRLVGRVTTAVVEARRRLRGADVRLGPVLGYGTASEFLRLLRPAWWVLRGYLAAIAVSYLFDGSEGLVPRLGGNEGAGLMMLALFVVASIWLGRRQAGFNRWGRRIVLASSALLVVIAFSWAVDVDRQAYEDYYGGYESTYGDPYGHISDVYVYDADGNLLTDVRLFDQNGQPIELGTMTCEWRGNGPPPQLRPYPRCIEYAPWGRPAPAATAPPLVPAEPTDTASPEVSPGTASPSPAATPSASSLPG